MACICDIPPRMRSAERWRPPKVYPGRDSGALLKKRQLQVSEIRSEKWQVRAQNILVRDGDEERLIGRCPQALTVYPIQLLRIPQFLIFWLRTQLASTERSKAKCWQDQIFEYGPYVRPCLLNLNL